MHIMKTGLALILPLILTACNAGDKPAAPDEDAQKTSEAQESRKANAVTANPISAGALSGMTINAGENSPHILIVPGSGPTDLDGNNPQGVAANSYKYLAEQLALNGISTTRVDKRGMFSSAAAGNPNKVSVDIYAEDYRAWIDTLTAQTGQDCIYLLGHSEGALMVSAAAEGRDDVCGLILIAGSGRKFGDLLRAQLKANPANAPILDQALGAINQMEAGESVDISAMHPALQGLFAPQVQDYLISLMAADPAEVAAKAGQIALILQGDHDLQTALIDAENLAARTGGKLIVLKGVNHVLKETPKDRAANIASYANPDLPIAESVTSAIKDFITAH